ncbi:MAG: transposase family protein [Amaricoccus sp.]|nr:transposase family protein [Amaricoccus sp.]
MEDPRRAWKVVYPLPEILLVVLCAALGGAEEFVEIARWGQGSPTSFGASCPASVGSSRTTL